MNPNRIALVVAVFSGTAVLGPMVGVSPAWITVAVISALVMVSVDAAAWNGRGGHLWRKPCLAGKSACAGLPCTKPVIACWPAMKAWSRATPWWAAWRVCARP